MTFNTVDYQVVCDTFEDIVLNLVINGWPSILLLILS